MALYMPEGALTAGSAVLLWDPVPGADRYTVYRNGKRYRERRVCCLSLRDLVHEGAYEFEVTAWIGAAEQGCGSLTVFSKVAPREFDVTRYGAVGDGLTDDTRALQNALDDCLPEGLVYLPAGRYRCGPLRLKSATILCLARGALLQSRGSEPLLLGPAHGLAHDLILEGRGCLQGPVDLRGGRRICLRDLTLDGPLLLPDGRDLTLDAVTLNAALDLTGSSRALALGCRFAQPPAPDTPLRMMDCTPQP